MKYYCYTKFDKEDNSSKIATISEREIINSYWDYWKRTMIYRYGEEWFEENKSEKSCIEDFIMVHWAWELGQKSWMEEMEEKKQNEI